jgi:hypothetical protein
LAERTCRLVAGHKAIAFTKRSGMSRVRGPLRVIRRLAWPDVVAIATLVVAVTLVLLPAVGDRAFRARATARQNGLWQIASTLIGYDPQAGEWLSRAADHGRKVLLEAGTAGGPGRSTQADARADSLADFVADFWDTAKNALDASQLATVPKNHWPAASSVAWDLKSRRLSGGRGPRGGLDEFLHVVQDNARDDMQAVLGSTPCMVSPAQIESCDKLISDWANGHLEASSVVPSVASTSLPSVSAEVLSSTVVRPGQNSPFDDSRTRLLPCALPHETANVPFSNGVWPTFRLLTTSAADGE